MVDWREDEDRWVERRTEYLSSTGMGLRETVAEAVAWAELGYSSSGIAKKMGVADTTAASYLDAAQGFYDGLYSAADLDSPEDSVDPPPKTGERHCPVCESDTLLSTKEAKKVFNARDWGSAGRLDEAEYVCSTCHAGKTADGRWFRVTTLNARVREMAMASSSKDRDDYWDKFTQGEVDPSKHHGSKDRSASNPDDKDW